MSLPFGDQTGSKPDPSLLAPPPLTLTRKEGQLRPLREVSAVYGMGRAQPERQTHKGGRHREEAEALHPGVHLAVGALMGW
jgi:hypothetical protein